MSADGCFPPPRDPIAGADIDGLIAASTAANARAIRYQSLAETIAAELRQLFEGRIERSFGADEQLLVDHAAFRDAIENAVNCGLGRLQHEADVEAGAAGEAVDDAVREAEAMPLRDAP